MKKYCILFSLVIFLLYADIAESTITSSGWSIGTNSMNYSMVGVGGVCGAYSYKFCSYSYENGVWSQNYFNGSGSIDPEGEYLGNFCQWMPKVASCGCSGWNPTIQAIESMIDDPQQREEAVLACLLNTTGAMELYLNAMYPDGDIDPDEFQFMMDLNLPEESPEDKDNLAAGADPIYLSNGAYDFSDTDLVLSGRGLPIGIVRTYNSKCEYNSRFGNGWDINYNMKVRPLYTPDDPGTEGIDESSYIWDVMLLNGKGQRYEFSRDDETDAKLYHTGDRGQFIVLDKADTQSTPLTHPYALVKKSGVCYYFNDDGNLARIEDRSGNWITLSYDSVMSDMYGYSRHFEGDGSGDYDDMRGVILSDYKLTQITDSVGNTLNFSYYGSSESGGDQGLLKSIYDTKGDRTWTYKYDLQYNDLITLEKPEVDDPNNPGYTYIPTVTYNYNDSAFPQAMTSIVDAEQQSESTPYLENSYEYNPETLRSQVAGQYYGEFDSNPYSLLYNSDSNRTILGSREKVQSGSNTLDKSVTVTVYNDKGQTVSETIASNPSDDNPPIRAFTTSYEYNAYDEISKVILPERNCVEYIYEEDPNSAFNIDELTVIQRPECDVLPFNGTSDYITVSDANDIYGFDPSTENFSVAFWVKRLDADVEEILLDKRDASGDGWCVKFNSTNKVVCSLDAVDITGTTDVNDSDWHYIVVSINRDGNGAIYVDGGSAEGITAINSETMDTTATLTIGRCSYAASGYFKGSLDEVMILDHALYRDKGNMYSIFGLSEYTQGLVGYWKMDDDTATTDVLDSSISENDGVAARNTTLMVDDGYVPGEIAIVTTFKQYDGLDYVDTVTDPNGNEVTYTYDFDDPNTYGSSVGNLMKITYPDVSTPQGTQTPIVSYTYNSYGQVLTVTSVDGIVTKFDYYTDPYDTDNYGRLWKTTVDYGTTDPNCLNIVTTVEYDDQGHVDKVTNPLNDSTEFTYDDLDRLVKTKLPAPFSYETELIYNRNDKLAQTKRAIGATYQYTDYAYNLLDKLKTVMDPLQNVTTMDYDDNENMISVLDAEENETTYEYDERDLLWKVTDANDNTTEYSYTPNGKLESIEDAEGNVTTYSYDYFDRLVRTTYPDDTYEAYTYNMRSQVTSSTNRDGDTVTNIYDNVGRLLTVVGPSNDPNITYTYDIAGRVVSVDHNDDITDFYYDRLGRVIQVEDPESRLVDYDYDDLSRRTELVYPDDSSITYEYDKLSRLTKIIDDSNSVIAEYTYDELSRRTLVTLQNDANAVYTYDLANRLTSLDNNLPDPNNSTITFDYTHDNVGNRLTMTVDGSDLHDYTYDEIYQLTDVDYPAGAGTDISYAYDSVHNRTSTDDGTVINYTDNNLNQYTAVGGTNLYYDNNGNLTDDGTYDYTYDIFNRLIEVQYNSATVAEYVYDYSGRRIEKTVYGTSTVTTKYAYDGAQVIAEYDGSDTLLRKFIYGPGIDEPICMIDVSDSNAVYYYHYDGLGSVIALSNINGDIVEAYSYDVFGTPTIYTDAGSDGQWRTSDDTTASVSAIDNPYMFTGRRYDDETGLYYYRARMYAPDLGRFMQTDPIGYADGINWYAYCGNSPLGFIDPMGLCKDKPWYKQSWEAIGGFGIGFLEFVYDTEVALLSPIDTLGSMWDGMYDMGERLNQTMYDVGANPGMISDMARDLKDLGGQILFEELDRATRDPYAWGNAWGKITAGVEMSLAVKKIGGDVSKYVKSPKGQRFIRKNLGGTIPAKGSNTQKGLQLFRGKVKVMSHSAHPAGHTLPHHQVEIFGATYRHVKGSPWWKWTKGKF